MQFSSLHGHDAPSPFERFVAEQPSVQFVHHHWIDLSGILRVRIVPIARCRAMARNHEPVRVGPLSLVDLCDSSLLPPDFKQVGFNTLHPDWLSARALSPIHASVLCSTFEGMPANPPSAPTCPRSALQGILETARTCHRLDFLAGFELEFVCLELSEASCSGRQTGSTADVRCQYSHNSMASATRGDRGAFLTDCAIALQEASIEVEQYHAESGPLQYEIALGPKPVMAAVDTLIQCQEIIRIVAGKYGFRACFLPRPFANGPTSGLHTHLSLLQGHLPGQSSRVRESDFLAGILHRLPLLCGFGMPSADSYRRVQPGCAGAWVTWGTENRHTPVRKIANGHYEFRAIDSTANMYLVLAAYLGAGLLGLQERQELRWKDCQAVTSRLDSQERERLGITTEMPKNLVEALAIIKDSRMGLNQLLGSGLMDLYVAVKEAERLTLSGMAEESMKALCFENF